MVREHLLSQTVPSGAYVLHCFVFTTRPHFTYKHFLPLLHLIDDVAPFNKTINTQPRFRHYINNLDHYFLNALQNVTRLATIGHGKGAIGQTASFKALVPLREECASRLKELELGYYGMQDELLEFLMAHSSTLEVHETCGSPTRLHSSSWAPETSMHLTLFFTTPALGI